LRTTEGEERPKDDDDDTGRESETGHRARHRGEATVDESQGADACKRGAADDESDDDASLLQAILRAVEGSASSSSGCAVGAS
jgi:hypothetical protein